MLFCNSKGHLETEIAQANLEIPPSSKTWEPYRAYEKRLTSASTKEKGKALTMIHNEPHAKIRGHQELQRKFEARLLKVLSLSLRMTKRVKLKVWCNQTAYPASQLP